MNTPAIKFTKAVSVMTPAEVSEWCDAVNAGTAQRWCATTTRRAINEPTRELCDAAVAESVRDGAEILSSTKLFVPNTVRFSTLPAGEYTLGADHPDLTVSPRPTARSKATKATLILDQKDPTK